MINFIRTLNEFYNHSLEQKISYSIWSPGGLGLLALKAKLIKWFALLQGIALDVGSGDGKWRTLLPSCCFYFALDYPPVEASTPWKEASASIYGDIQHIPIKDSTVDAILNIFVLEHVPDPDRAVKECARVLQKSGQLILVGPGDILMSHGEPYNFFNMTRFAYSMILRRYGFEVQEEYYPFKFWMSLYHIIGNKLLRHNSYNKNAFTKILQIPILIVFLAVSPAINMISLLLDYITPFDFRGYSVYMVRAIKR